MVWTVGHSPSYQWPHAVELLYYSDRIMVGLGMLFILTMDVESFLLTAGAPGEGSPHALGADAGIPIPLHRDDRGVVDRGEMGRQPWVGHGLLRTDRAHSELVNSGDVIFTTLGFAGLYLLLAGDPPQRRVEASERRAASSAVESRNSSRVGDHCGCPLASTKSCPQQCGQSPRSARST